MLADLGALAPALRTLFRSPKGSRDNDYRDRIAKACTAFSATAAGLSALVMYDCTTLHLESSDEDAGPHGLRKVGMSKEHRVDPQAQVGLLVDPSGFPRFTCSRATPPRPPPCSRSCAPSGDGTG